MPAATVQRTISPVDGSVVAERPLATPRQVDAVLDRAAAAQRSWRRVPLDDRVAVVDKLGCPVDGLGPRPDRLPR